MVFLGIIHSFQTYFFKCQKLKRLVRCNFYHIIHFLAYTWIILPNCYMGISYWTIYYFGLEYLIDTKRVFWSNKNLIHSFFSTPSSLAYPPQQTFIPSSQSILNDVIDARSWNEFWVWNLTLVEKWYVPLILYALSLFWHLSKRYLNHSFVKNTIEWL